MIKEIIEKTKKKKSITIKEPKAIEKEKIEKVVKTTKKVKIEKKTKVVKKEKTKKLAKVIKKDTESKEIKTSVNPVKEEGFKEVKYFEAVGRRKTANARVRLFTNIENFKNIEEDFIVNKKFLKIYFPTLEAQETIFSPFKEVDCVDRFRVSVVVKGGGVFAQAGAIRHGIVKALMLFNPDFRKKLKKAGYLTRDPRMRERKKFGLKRARRAPQWSKR